MELKASITSPSSHSLKSSTPIPHSSPAFTCSTKKKIKRFYTVFVIIFIILYVIINQKVGDDHLSDSTKITPTFLN
ncbi:hypothetical protein Hanom_Chr06g00543411 [Helianthus anomalus]